ncbi:MAG: hypothetical protein IIA82_08030 [Thaumarchaeota archaeon]|nr:hypothetical protein [Nitrososphaerota archaeon]
MKTDNLIKQLSSRIDNLLNDEKKINDLTTEDLRELVTIMLEGSYKKAREKAGFGLGGNVVGIGINLIGALFSKPDWNKTMNLISEEYEEKQNEIDQKWYVARKRLDSCSASDLFWILYLNRTKTFDVTVSYILNRL